MKNKEKWRPTKYVYQNNRLIGSRDSKELGVASRLITDLVANLYDEQLKKHCSGKLLDLGCGNVPLYIAYKDHISDVVTVDWGNTLHKNIYIDYECDLTQDLLFTDNEFDTIILSDVLEHIPNPQHLYGEISRILKPGGKLIMNVPFYYWLHETPHDYYRYTKFALNFFHEEAGLEIIELRAIGGVPEILADLISKNIFLLPIIGKRKLSAIVQELTLRFVHTKLGAKISSTTSNNFPFGYFVISQKQ
jgi:SAM-dependent methyltransferase